MREARSACRERDPRVREHDPNSAQELRRGDVAGGAVSVPRSSPLERDARTPRRLPAATDVTQAPGDGRVSRNAKNKPTPVPHTTIKSAAQGAMPNAIIATRINTLSSTSKA